MYSLHVQLGSQGPIALNAEFDCQPGELVALLGPSGSGKTSLLRAIAGLLPAAGLHGTVRLGSDVWFDSSRGIHWPPQARRVGLVFQSYALFPHMTAIENIAIGAYSTRAIGQNGHEVQAYIQGLMERMGLAGLAQRLPNQLSGGQQQRVALARALLRLRVAPEAAERDRAGSGEQGVLLLDEPFSAVDAPTRQTLYRELAALRQHVSTPMVLVTHDLLEARRLADRVVVVDGGTTLQTGTPAKVFGQPRNARVAQLVGIQNLFKGRFYKAEAGWARLHWTPQGLHATDNPQVLHTLDKGRIDDGAEVSWVLAGESMEVTARCADPHAPENELLRANVLDCVLEEALALGETSLCTLKPLGLGADRLTLTLSTAQLRAMGTGVGGVLQVHIAPQAIHIMPVRA